jgi:hypothetical protein
MKSIFEKAVILLAFFGALILTLLIFFLIAIWLSIPLYFLGISKQLIILITCGVSGVSWLIFVIWKITEAIQDHNATGKYYKCRDN